MGIRSKIHFCDFMTSWDPIEIGFADHRPSYLTVLPRPLDSTNVSSSFVSAYIQLTIKHFPFFFFRSLLSHNFIASKRSAWISILFALSDIHKLFFFFLFLSSINCVSPIFGIIIVNWIGKVLNRGKVCFISLHRIIDHLVNIEVSSSELFVICDWEV